MMISFWKILRIAPAACCVLVLLTHHAAARDRGTQDNAAPWWEIEANLAVASEYRFRGVSLSDESVALQGGVDLATKYGFYAGFWGTNIEEFEGSLVETDYYGGYAHEAGGVTLDAGFILYAFPGSDDTHYWEITGAVSGEAGPVSLKAGANYAFEQDNIGGNDNYYVYGDLDYPLPVTAPFSLSFVAHAGYEEGAFGTDSFGEAKWDWSLGLAFAWRQLRFSAAYVDTDIDSDETDSTVVFILGGVF